MKTTLLQYPHPSITDTKVSIARHLFRPKFDVQITEISHLKEERRLNVFYCLGTTFLICVFSMI